MEYISLIDIVLLPFVLVLIYYLARLKQSKNIEAFPEYKYYIKGLTVKIIGALSLAIIYSFYYSGGDTVNYFHDAICLDKLLFSNPGAFLKVLIEGVSKQNYYYFSIETGYPIYYRDPATTMVARITSIVTLISFRSFLVTSILFAWFSYMGIWCMYRVFLYEFPHLSKEMAIAILFVPSVFFWGSGILKDTVTFSASGFFTYNFYMFFIKRKFNFSFVLGLFLSSFFIIKIKPYIIFAFLPGCLLWVVNNIISHFRGSLTRGLAAPIFIVVAVITGYFLLNTMRDQLGDYSLEKVLDKAVLSQQDLKAEYYQGNSFDLGDLEPTIPSLLSKAHLAVNAALFRPYIWECKNVVMYLSGIEDLVLLIFTISIILRVKIFGIFKYFIKHHMLTFSLVFSLFFAFSVGISTSNFGSMVRYRIPIFPFYIASLFIIRDFHRKELQYESEATIKELGRKKNTLLLE